jgi:hypothetical protein
MPNLPALPVETRMKCVGQADNHRHERIRNNKRADHTYAVLIYITYGQTNAQSYYHYLASGVNLD